MASEGRYYDEDEQVEYDVIDYQVNTSFAPDREWIDGQTRMKVRVKAYALGVLTLRLAETLTVSSVTSDELGRLLFLRVRNQNSIVVNLPSSVPRDSLLTMTVAVQRPAGTPEHARRVGEPRTTTALTAT